MKPILTLLALCTILALSACASSPSIPFKSKENFGTEVAQVSKTWQKGEAEIKKGQGLVKDGKKLIRKGESEVSDAKTDERKRKARLADAKDNYEAALMMSGGAEPAAEQTSESTVLKALAKDITNAQSGIDKAMKAQKRGRNMVSDGKDKIKKGEKLMRQGERRKKIAKEDYRDIGN